MRALCFVLASIVFLGCKTTDKQSDLLGNQNRNKRSQKRIAYLNPPPGSKYKSDFDSDFDGIFLKKLVDPAAYKNKGRRVGKERFTNDKWNERTPIPERPWDILTYDCNQFANDAVIHLRDQFYVYVKSYTYAHRDEYEDWDMRNLTVEQLEELEEKIPNPYLTQFDKSIFNTNSWKEKYRLMSRMVEQSGMHSGLVIKIRRWNAHDDGKYLGYEDRWAFIEPQSGYLIVDWPVKEGRNPSNKRVARTLLHHMYAQEGYFSIVGGMDKAVFDPSDIPKEPYYCAVRTKAAFSWANGWAWVVHWGNNTSRRSHCGGCCADKTHWAKTFHDTDGDESNIDDVYLRWYKSCKSICNDLFKK